MSEVPGPALRGEKKDEEGDGGQVVDHGEQRRANTAAALAHA